MSLLLTSLLWIGGCHHGVEEDDTGVPDEVLSCAADQLSAVGARLHDDYGTLVYVDWEQAADATVWVEYRFDEGDWRSTPTVQASAGPQEALLLGVPYDTEVAYRVSYSCEDAGPFRSSEGTILTGPRPSELPAVEVLASDEARWDPSLNYVFTSVDGVWSVILDRQGRIVWARPSSEYTLYPRLSQDGHSLLIDEGTFWSRFDDGVASQVVRTRIDGSEETVYDTPGLFIGFTDLPDGSIAWPATGDSTAEINDDTLRILSPTGEQTDLWSCRDFWMAMPDLWMTKSDWPSPPGDYCAANTLSWSEARGSFLWTSFAPEMIVEIDPERGQALRVFGHVKGAWEFAPDSQPFWLPHGAYFTDADTLLMSSDVAEDGEETIVVEYALDDATHTLTEVWSFGQGEGLYGQERGEAHRLPGGNTLHNIGGVESRLREITPDGEVVWDVHVEAAGGIGGSSPIEDLYALVP